MGLLYLFPVSQQETHYVELKDQKLTVKSYGLPLVFWAYALAIFGILFFMFMAIKNPLFKLIEYQDGFNYFIFIAVLSLFISVPVVILGFFFFEKTFIKEKNMFTVLIKIFGITIYKKKYTLNSTTPFKIQHFLESPNMARMSNHENSLGFQNKGYFELLLETDDHRKIKIDRCSKKIDLEKLIELFNTNN
jgi:hypothetical protein